MQTEALDMVSPELSACQASSPYLFVIDNKRNEHNALPLKEIFNIGRDPVNDLVLDSPLVSRLHASILRQEDGSYRLVDQNSTNGIKINGYRASDYQLHHGDTFTISHYACTYLDSKLSLADLTPDLTTSRDIAPDDEDATIVLDCKTLRALPCSQQEPSPDQPPLGGSLLRQVRRQNRISIQEAARRTKISATNIRAMEEEDFSALPVDTYLKSFLRSYAQFLGLDAETLTREYLLKREKTRPGNSSGSRKDKRIHHRARRIKGERRFRKSIATNVLFIIILIISFLLFSYHLDL